MPNEALNLLNQANEQYGEEPEFLNNLAVAHIGNNEPDKALSILREIVDNDPMLSIVVHNLIEMELGATGAIPEQLNPILFVQSVDSFENEEIASTQRLENKIGAGPDFNEPQDASLLANALTAVVQSWAVAWSRKDIDRYLSHYAIDFVPSDGSTQEEWIEQRENRLAKPGEIVVTISNLTIISDGASPRIAFDQAYRSETYSDKTLKEISFSNDNDRWKIQTEKTIKTY